MVAADTLRTVNDSATDAARQRLLSIRGEPLFFANWERVLMIHFEVDAAVLQHDAPFELDRHDGRAFVSVVAFTMRGMRPRVGGRLAAWLFRPIATHDFLNVRTYVRHRGEPGIHFLTEWLSNRLAVRLGPMTFGLPYRHGHIHYEHDWGSGHISGWVRDGQSASAFSYRAELAGAENAAFAPCDSESLAEWLMERYTAFNSAGGRRRLFRVWHAPWRQCAADVRLEETSLLCRRWRWFESARFYGANFSPGLKAVWMGRPHRVPS